ncbi:hypothetical protein [Clostridium estertheticum]|uniref:hypothetical protein n=1 Tax=Clostridium estertheticum TaxID=238834 RepID=UPI001CF1D46B|nr:hypothetical protein [Clostridium estertheticum]MCB2362141.1 hypothetical protein [Clostridium estertheticum]
MCKIFYDDGKGLLKIFAKMMQEFEVDSKFPSLTRSIKRFNFDDVYTDVLEYHEHIMDYKEEYDNYISENILVGNEVVDRYKAEESLQFKWNKNCNEGRRLFEVCNDAWAIRVITNLTVFELQNEINKIRLMAEELQYKIEIVDFYKQPKNDGYMGIHVYFKNNSRCYPVEMQFWTRRDWFLQRYTHEVIYKQDYNESTVAYSMDLRKWVDSIPNCPIGVDSFIDYYYEIISSIN